MFKGSTPLFQSPLLLFEHPEAAALNPLLVEEFRTRQRTSQGTVRSNLGGWHSDADFFRRQEPATRRLANFIAQSLLHAEKLFAPDAQVDETAIPAEGWININPKGAFNAPHVHPGYAWSGTYYVNLPRIETSRSGMIEFLDPRSGISAWPMTKGELTNTKIQLLPAPGTLLIFPSYLVHWVYPNESEEDRITVAFNARFQPKR